MSARPCLDDGLIAAIVVYKRLHFLLYWYLIYSNPQRRKRNEAWDHAGHEMQSRPGWVLSCPNGLENP